MEKLQTFYLLLALALPQIKTDTLPRVTANENQIQVILNTVFVVIGAIAVMMVVIGGIKFAGSQGEAQGVAKAKSTIVYAIVGLIISIFAVVIVDFVFGNVT